MPVNPFEKAKSAAIRAIKKNAVALSISAKEVDSDAGLSQNKRRKKESIFLESKNKRRMI